jgi:PAS domain S-box-containing protein
MSAQPLELILARNLLSSLSTPGTLLGEDGRMLFFNEAAGAVLGRSFEEVTGMSAEEWLTEFGLLDPDGQQLPYPLTASALAMRDGRPHHTEYILRRHTGELTRVAASAIPVGEGGQRGAIVLFWVLDADGAPDDAAAERIRGGPR